MKRILLTGISGTGKSSVIRALADLGYKAIDTDDGWSEQLPDGRQRWREDAFTALLATEDADVLFLAGCEEAGSRSRDLNNHATPRRGNRHPASHRRVSHRSRNTSPNILITSLSAADRAPWRAS